MKLLTYIIPLYNSSKWLCKCLDSVLNQDIPEENVEIICVNDGSPDNSADIARSYQKNHPCIVVLDQENQGPSGARNNGMRHATGKYLAFVDPDDFVEPNVFGGLVKQMEDKQLDMLRFNFQMVDEMYHSFEKPLAEKLFDYTPRLMSGPEFLAQRLDGACNIWRYLYRTEIITKNKIWCYTGDYYDDTPWLPLVLMKAEKMDVCDTIVYDYLQRSDSLVKSLSPVSVKKKTAGYFFLLEVLQKQLKSLKTYMPDANDDMIRGVGNWYLKMESYSVISLICMTTQYNFEKRHECISKIKELGLLPLRGKGMVPKSARKQKIINVSPLLLMWMLKIQNGQK